MKYYIIAGEASGDLHASNLMKELKRQDENADFRFWGGDLMQAVGGTNVSHFKDRAFMGFVEVLVNLKTVLGHIKHCKADLAQHIPDALILVDYPGFNMRIAEYAKTLNIPVFYYISPQIWAWKEGRIKGIKAFVDHMFVILPFEKPFYKKHNYKVDYVGHPLLDAVKDSSPDENFKARWNLDDSPILALLPGSRKQEIKTKLPVMLSVMKDFPDYQFVLAAAPGIDAEYYLSFTQSSRVKVVKNDTYQLLMHAEAALVTSGTATLETALFGVPQVVCYKTSAITYAIAKRLVKIKYISLVNLIMDKPVVTELIQGEMTTEAIRKELKSIIAGGLKRRKIMDDYAELKNKLGNQGASEKTAKLILGYMNEKRS